LRRQNTFGWYEEENQPCAATYKVKLMFCLHYQTFVVGGGKKVRSKYREQLPKEFIEALRAVGYIEDRGASACKECQRMYKYQHDTDKV
jgi:hypothetical protein